MDIVLALKGAELFTLISPLSKLSGLTFSQGERGGLVVNASDSGSRGSGFEPQSGQTVLCP